MGYTHYWNQSGILTDLEWSEFTRGVRAIAERPSPKLVYEYNASSRKPRIDDVAVRFNGPGEKGHETFYIKNLAPSDDGFNFCKTAAKPYDLAVTACLAYLDSICPNVFTVSSDGDPSDWEAGVKLAKSVWPEVADRIDVPRKVRDEDYDTGGYRD